MTTADRPTLEDMQKLFPRAHYAPDPDCKRCKGTGVTGPKRVIAIGKKPDGKLGSWIEERPDEASPCVCVFIDDPAIRAMVMDGMKELAEEHSREMEAKKSG